MIVPAGVLIPGDVAGTVRAALVRHVQAERIGDPAVHRLLDELRSVADRPAGGGRGVPALDGPAESVAVYAARTGTPARTVRRWCAAGRLEATRRDGRWKIYREATGSSSASQHSNAP